MMDLDGDRDELPCDGISDENFNRFLKEPVFVDFLNTFLSLPIFPKRLNYSLDDDVFEVDPPVRRTAYFLLQRKVKIWVYQSRLPFFFQTDIYLDYLLCRLLAKSYTVSVEIAEMYFNTAEDMYTFRRFIKGTMGERMMNFWLDAERYRRQVKPENRRYVLREIQNKYLRGGAPFELNDTMKWMSLCGGTRGLETKSFTAPAQVSKKLCGQNISVFSGDIFTSLQNLVIRRLRTYWVPKFVVHREKIRKRVKARWSLDRGKLVNKKEEEAAKLDAIRELALIKEEQAKKNEIDEYMEAHKVESAESIDDEEKKREGKRQLMERWSEWFWESSRAASRDSNDEESSSSTGGSRLSYRSPYDLQFPTPVNVTTPRSKGTPASLKSSASSPLPRLCATPASKTGSRLGRSVGSESDSILSTPEVLQELNKILSEDPPANEEEKEEQKPKKKQPSPTHVRMELEKYRLSFPKVDPPYALTIPEKDKPSKTLFEAVLSENGEGTQDKKHGHPSDFYASATAQAIQEVSHPRIIQLGVTPEEVLKVLFKPRTALPRHIMEYQRFLQNTAPHENALLKAVSSDRFAGSPFYKYLENTKNEEALVRLQFWNESQRYLVPQEALGTTAKYRMAKMMVVTFLMPDSPSCVPMNALVRKELLRLLPIEQGDAILFHESRIVIQGLRSAWLEYIRAEEDHFTSSVTQARKPSRKIQTPFSVLEAEESSSSSSSSSEDDDDDMFDKEDVDDFKGRDQIEANAKAVPWRARGAPTRLAAGFSEESSEEDEEESDEEVKILLPSLKQINKERDIERAENVGFHFYGGVKKENPQKSSSSTVVTKTRPNRPRNFQECLLDNAQFAWFKCYLTEQSSDTPLLFWQAVENMKSNSKDAKSRQSRANAIVRKYFINIDVPATEYLQCKADIIRDIPVIEKVTPPMLLSAQACVARTLEEEWFRKYVSTFPEEDEGNLQKYAMRNTLAGVYKMAAHGKTRGLWAMFASNVMNFQKGIYDPKTSKEFVQFLHKENEATIEHNTRRHALNPTRRMINNKFINTEKLSNDLSFWKEVVKFKEVADNANESAKRGNYSTDDEMQVLSKAKTIVKVFLDSDLPPRIQINIANDLGESMINLVNAGIVERGIFHDAQLSVFITLIHYWKKFAAERKNQKKEQPDVEQAGLAKKDGKDKSKRVSYLGNVPYRRVYVMQDDETRWSFSCYQGLRLAIPIKLLARRVTCGDVLPDDLGGGSPTGR